MTGTGAAVIVLAIADPDREIALDDTECLQRGTSGGCYVVSIYQRAMMAGTHAGMGRAAPTPVPQGCRGMSQ